MNKARNAPKQLLRSMCVIAIFAAALAMAQQDTPPEDHPDARPRSESGASKWGPTRTHDTAPSAAPRASTAATIRDPYSVKEPSSSAPGVANPEVPPASHSAGTGLQAEAPPESSSGGTTHIASSGSGPASGSRRKTKKNKTHPTAFSSNKVNRETLMGRAGIHHSRAKIGVHKTKRHVTW
jgi:hypothetical protein